MAVALPDAARKAVAELMVDVRAQLGPDGDGVRWVREDGLHLTLRFLGATPESRVADVALATTEAAVGGFPVPLAVGRGGAFPTPRRPRVLWLSVIDGADRLRVLSDDLDAHLAAAGWPPETRPLTPHLTLARVAEPHAGAAAAAFLTGRAEAFSISWTAETLTLFESRTGRGPARYEIVVEAPLGR